MEQINKYVVVACEGQHDIAFIARVLRTVGFSENNKKISDFPYPFDRFFKTIAASMKLDDRKLGYHSPNFLLPSVALSNGRSHVFLHNLNGDGRQEERFRLLANYRGLVGDDDFTKDSNISFRFLLFFDADIKGVNSRLSEIKNEFALQADLVNGQVVPYEQHEIGCYIYHEDGAETGVLEDLLLKHFCLGQGNDSLSKAAEDFLNANELPINRTKEMAMVDGQEVAKGNSKYNKKKSQVNLFGQLQFSGMNNSVIISKSDFIKKETLEKCEQCLDIVRMFETQAT